MPKAHRRFAYQGAGSGTQQHCHLSTGIRVLGFPLYSERAFDFYFLLCSEFCGFQDTNHQTKTTASSVTHSLHIISSLRLGPGWKFGLHFRARQVLSQYRVASAFVSFGLVVLLSFSFYCLSPLRLTIRGTCSNALQPGKKGPGQKLWTPNSSSLFGFSRRHKKALLDDTPIRDVVCAHHFKQHNPLDLAFPFLFFSCTISRPWMTDITT